MSKKYRTITFLLLTVLILSLVCGCAKKEKPKEEPKVEEEPPQEEIIDVDSLAMSNYMVGSKYFIDEGWMYGQGEGANSEPTFSKMRLDGSEQMIIADNQFAGDICKYSDYLYFTLEKESEMNTGKCKLYKCRLSGDDLECIVDHYVSSVFLIDDRLYYQKTKGKKDSAYGLFSCNLDGSDEVQLFGKKKKMKSPYITESLLFYIKDNKKHELHKYNLETKEDSIISKKFTYSYVINDDYVYYCALRKPIKKYKTIGKWERTDPYEDGIIYKRNIKNDSEKVLYEGVAASEELLISKNKLFFVNTNDSCRLYSMSIKDNSINAITEDKNIQPLGISKKRVIYYDLNDNFEYYEAISSCLLDGSKKIILAG